MADFYSTLGVSKTATDAEIKAAYRKLALEWHPDRNKTAGATEKFKDINKAYETLGDAKKRTQYDQYGHDAYTRSGAASASAGGQGGAYSYQQGPFSYTYSSGGGQQNPFEGVDFGGQDPFQIFEQFFGFQSPFGGQSRQQRKPREVYQIQLSFAEAVKGIEKTIKLGGKNRTVKIPAGVDDGMRMRFTEFDLLIRVTPDARFKRDGQDVYYEMEIGYPLAVLGGTIKVPSLRSTTVKLKVRPGTKSGTIVRLQHEGIPYPDSPSRKGDQYVVYRIAVPDKVTAKVKKLLEELGKEL